MADLYENPEQAGALGSWGPQILGAARALHLRDIGKEVLAGGFKRGGRVKKTGIYQLHEGERVIPKGGYGKAFS